jgi:hypothetical protein
MRQNPHKLKEAELKAQQEKQKELEKIKELREQFEQEKESTSDMSWMYTPSTMDKKQQQEDLLLGNKKYEPLDNVKEYGKLKSHHVPGALFIGSQRHQDNVELLNTIDSRNKMREDPLAYILSAQEKAAREKLKDPRSVQQLKDKIEKQKKKLHESKTISKPIVDHVKKTLTLEEKQRRLEEMKSRLEK